GRERSRRSGARGVRGAAPSLADAGHHTSAAPLPVRRRVPCRVRASPASQARDPGPGTGRRGQRQQPGRPASEQGVRRAADGRSRARAAGTACRSGHARARGCAYRGRRRAPVDQPLWRVRAPAKGAPGAGVGGAAVVEGGRIAMRRDDRAFDREVEAMLERGRAIRPLPDVVRARALARARATIAKGAEATPAMAAPTAARTHGRRIALAAAFTLLIGGAVAGAAIRGGVLERFRSAPAPVPTTPIAPPRPQAPPAVAPEPASPPKPAERRHAARAATAQESYEAELGLLHRAHVACASREFS